MPFHLDRLILAQLDALVPEFEADVCRPNVDLDTKVDPMILRPTVPPVSVFEFEKGEWKGGKVGFDLADGAAC